MVPLLFLFLVASCLAAASESPEPPADRVGDRLREFLLGAPGQSLMCLGCPGEPAVSVDAATGIATEVPLPYHQINDLVHFPDRKRILAATSSESGKRSLLLVLNAASLAPLGRVEIPGNGRRIVISPDGYFAYVLCHRPARGGEEAADAGKWDLLGVDLGRSDVTETYPLAHPASDLAVAPRGDRLFVALRDRIQTFATHPLTASWYYRSPGDNRRLAVRPRSGQLYVLRDTSVAIFEPAPRPNPAEPSEDSGDDVSWVLASPNHVDRIGFSPDGLLAVAAGRGLDELLVLDTEERRIAGTWPEDSTRLGSLLEAIADAGKPRGPRGKLARSAPGFSPPLTPPPPPLPPARANPPLSGGAGRGDPGGVVPPVLAQPRAEPVSPSVEASDQDVPPGGATGSESGPASSVLEEVAEQVLEGRITGNTALVTEVILFGPDSLTKVRDRTTPLPDGTYSFKLPTRGRYRIVLTGGPSVTLVCRPAFQTLEVGDFGFKGLDFRVLRAIGGTSR